MGNTEEHATARQIILDKNNFIYTGWKVARKLANWIHNNDEWTKFLNEKKSVENHDNDVLVNDIVRPTKVGNAINDGNWIPSKPTYSLKSLRHSCRRLHLLADYIYLQSESSRDYIAV